MATDNAWIGEGDVKVYFVNNNEEDEEVLESFRRKTSQGVFQDITSESQDDADGYLCFKVALKHHKAKNQNAKPVFFCNLQRQNYVQ